MGNEFLILHIFSSHMVFHTRYFPGNKFHAMNIQPHPIHQIIKISILFPFSPHKEVEFLLENVARILRASSLLFYNVFTNSSLVPILFHL